MSEIARVVGDSVVRRAQAARTPYEATRREAFNSGGIVRTADDFRAVAPKNLLQDFDQLRDEGSEATADEADRR